MAYTAPTARDAVRRLIQDGVTNDATPIAFNYSRLEDITDQIPAVATPTLRQFIVRFQSVPTEEYVTVFVIPGTLRAYLDGSTIPVAPSTDVDQGGNFTLTTPPTSALQITYAWQYFTDSDIDSYVDQARAWLGYTTGVDAIPDGLGPALVSYSASLAETALARKSNLANARAGDAEMGFADLAKAYAAQAKQLMSDAVAARSSYYKNAGANQTPALDIGSPAISNYQPPR